MSESLFQQVLIIFSFSLIGTIVFRRLRVAPIVAYIVVGAIIGPSALMLIPTPEQFGFLAEFGVVFLLFTLGLEFSFRRMMAIRFAVFGVGSVQVLVCGTVFAIAVLAWGVSLASAIIIAGALALSSTAIVTRELINNRQTHSLHGQLSIGVLLFQDLVAVFLLILVPVLGQGEDQSIVRSLALAAFNAMVLLLLLFAAGRWVLPRVYREVAKGGSDEIFLLTTLVIVLLVAWLTHSLHLSMALGGFVTGMVLGESPFRYQVQADIRPFRDILLGLFFVTIGMNLDLSMLTEFWPRIVLFSLVLLTVKVLVVAASVRLLGFGNQDSLTVGLNLAQAGEFGLALIALAVVNGIVPAGEGTFITIVAICSMLAGPFLIRHAALICRTLSDSGTAMGRLRPVQLNLKDHVIIGGFGRLGTTLAKFLETNGIDYIAIDTDIDVVERYRREGKNIVYGDSHNPEILTHCHLDSALLVVLTFKSMEEGKAAISGIRHRNPRVPIIIRSLEDEDFEELLSVGANQVFPELLESSLIIARQALEFLDIPEQEIERQIGEYRQTNRKR